MSSGAPVPSPPTLTLEERRWLHDKYQRLSDGEAQLADYRTSYFAAIVAGLIAALVLLTINDLSVRTVYAVSTSMIALLGLLISIMWAAVLRRTTAAQELWREAALQLEEIAPPFDTEVRSFISLPGGRPPLRVDLGRPYHAHALRFESRDGIPWFDRIRPSRLWAGIPILLMVAWGAVLVIVWVRYILTG